MLVFLSVALVYSILILISFHCKSHIFTSGSAIGLYRHFGRSCVTAPELRCGLDAYSFGHTQPGCLDRRNVGRDAVHGPRVSHRPIIFHVAKRVPFLMNSPSPYGASTLVPSFHAIFSSSPSQITINSGYTASCKSIVSCAQTIVRAIKEEITELYVLGEPPASVVAFGSKHPRVDVLAVGDKMSERGWHLNGLANPAAVHIACTVSVLFCCRLIHGSWLLACICASYWHRGMLCLRRRRGCVLWDDEYTRGRDRWKPWISEDRVLF